jgi:hypothetical protein
MKVVCSVLDCRNCRISPMSAYCSAEEIAVTIIQLDAVRNIFDAFFSLVNYLYFEKDIFIFNCTV